MAEKLEVYHEIKKRKLSACLEEQGKLYSKTQVLATDLNDKFGQFVHDDYNITGGYKIRSLNSKTIYWMVVFWMFFCTPTHGMSLTATFFFILNVHAGHITSFASLRRDSPAFFLVILM